MFGPVSLGLTVALTAASGLGWAWPWVLAVLPALLGGGAGVALLFSVARLSPGPDPHRNRSTPLDSGDTTGIGIVLFFLTLLAPLPLLALLVPGAAAGDPLLQWSAVPVGVAIGVGLAWWLGRIAHRQLARRGPELLQLMRTGHPPASAAEPATTTFDAMDDRERGTALTAMVAGILAQGLVAMVLKVEGSGAKVWFLALYLPGPWQWPVIGLMVLLGLGLLGLSARTWSRARRRAAATA